MRIMAFADIHSNKHALEAILKDASIERLDQIVCAGDLVGYGPHPNEVIENIRRHGISTVMGNYDEAVGFERDECGCAFRNRRERELGEVSLEWTKVHVTPKNKAYLRSLPRQLSLVWENSMF